MNLEKEAYNQIFKLLHKNKDICVFDVGSLEYKAKNHLFGLELRDLYGLDIDPKKVNSINYQTFGDKNIGLFGEKHRRTISYPIDGRQPNDEYLFMIDFPTGAFIFGDGDIFDKDYPTDFFEKFWTELKSYNPDYIDEVNHSLYWKLENAKDAFNNYDSILKKYHDLNKKDIEKRKIKKLKAELEKLENSNQ